MSVYTRGKRADAETVRMDVQVRQPLCFCGLDGLVWESNQAFSQLLGYEHKAQVTGLSLLNKTASTDNEASSQVCVSMCLCVCEPCAYVGWRER